MKNARICTVDELRRLLLPQELCKELGWTVGSKIAPKINEADKLVELLPDDNGSLHLDDLYRVALTGEHLTALGWSTKDKIAITLDTDNSRMTLMQENSQAK